MMMMMMTIKRGAPQRVVKIFHDQCEKKIITMSIMPVGMMVKDGDTLTLHYAKVVKTGFEVVNFDK